MKKESLSIVYQDGEAKDEEFFICFLRLKLSEV